MRMEWEIHFSWDLCEKKNSHMKIIREFDENLTSHLRIISLKWDQVRVIWGYVRSRENHMRSCEIIWDFSVRVWKVEINKTCENCHKLKTLWKKTIDRSYLIIQKSCGFPLQTIRFRSEFCVEWFNYFISRPYKFFWGIQPFLKFQLCPS